MNLGKENFIQNLIIYNFITCIFLFPIGIGFSVVYVFLSSIGMMIFGKTMDISSIIIPICMIILFIAINIFLYSKNLRKKRGVRVVLLIYFIADSCLSTIIFLKLSYTNLFNNSFSLEHGGTRIIGKIIFVILILTLIIYMLIVIKFLRTAQCEQKKRIIRKLYKTYFLLISLFAISFFVTSNFYFYAVHSILENIILCFALSLEKDQLEETAIL